MTNKNFFISLLIFNFCLCSFAQKKEYRIHTVAFYNLENLFDTIKSANTYDEEFTPKGARAWGTKKYRKKLELLSKAISDIGKDENNNMPTILGVCELENRNVLEDLIKTPLLKKANYGIVHFDSPDKRGIDVALLYQTKYFKPTSTKKHTLYLYEEKEKKQSNKKGKRIYTRDQLLVTGMLEGEEFHFIVNHWPSRSSGEKKSSINREKAAQLNRKIIDSLLSIKAEAKIITMGDLNDTPFNNSVSKVLNAKGKIEQIGKKDLFNPMWQMAKNGQGTIAHRDSWDVFDHIIISASLLKKDYKEWRYWKANIFSPSYLIQKTGPFKGYPLRNQRNGEPGYSDHFPVFIYLIKEQKN